MPHLYKTENEPIEVLNAKQQEDLLKLAATTLKIELEKDKPSRDIPFRDRKLLYDPGEVDVLKDI